jgi:opacity protein-like surface antigen
MRNLRTPTFAHGYQPTGARKSIVSCSRVFVAVWLVMIARPAFADITGFIGATTTPANRLVRGVAAGGGFLVIGFEFEYADTTDDPTALAPSLRSGMGNVLLQPPVPIFGVEPYFTAGGGIYRETLGAHVDTSFGMNIGGGVKVTLVGPLRVRVDYRVFKLGSGALYSPAHRVYVGLNVKL